LGVVLLMLTLSDFFAAAPTFDDDVCCDDDEFLSPDFLLPLLQRKNTLFKIVI
jgi:hypothetical protein